MNWYKLANKKECKGWVSIKLPEILSNQIKKWGKDNIKNNILCEEEGCGRESDPHVTIIYGVCDNNIELIKEIMKEYESIKVKLGKVGYFKSDPKHDVVKIEIISKDLRKLHEDIKRKLEVTESFNKYNPHATIAYVKKGEAHQFAGNDFIESKETVVKEITFINNEGEEFEVKLQK